MRQCLKSPVLEEAGTILKILKIDISIESNSLTYKVVDIVFQAEKELKTLLANTAINEKERSRFQNRMQSCSSQVCNEIAF